MSSDPVSITKPYSSSSTHIRHPPSEQHLRIHSTSSSDGSSSSSPPTLAFVNLSDRRGSLRSVDLDPCGRPIAGPWNESPRSRRGSLAKRSGELSWSANKPASPVPSRRPSLTPSLSFNYASTGPGSPAVSGGGGHHRGRRPSSSSSAVTIRAGSPQQNGLLPFGHTFKAQAAAARRSSLTPSTHVSHTNISSPTTTAVSIGGHISPATEHLPLGSPFLQPSPSRELRTYRFGTSPPPSTSLAGRAHRRPSYEPPESEDADAEDDDDEIDRARERFREQLLKAGLSSIPISLPPSPGAKSPGSSRPKPVLGPVSRQAPYGTVVSSVDSSASSSHSGSNRTASNSRPNSSPAFQLERRPSGRHYHPESRLGPATESSSEEDDGALNPPPRMPLRQSMSRQSVDARRLGLEVRTVIRPADDGSGIEDESESEESELGNHSSSSAQIMLTDGSFGPALASGSSSQGVRSLAAWDSYDLGDRVSPPVVLPQPTHELIRHLAPAIGLEERPRRKSISPQQPFKIESAEDRTLLGAAGGVRRGSKQDASPPRSLSDSAVPRRPSLAEELQAAIPPVHLNPSGAASVGGNDDVEWDLDFVLGGSGPVSADSIAPEYQIANGMRTARPGAQFGLAELGFGPGFDQFGAPDVQNDSFAQFVRDKDPIFEEMRVAWTLVKPQPPSNEWALPTTGGYTYLHSLAALNSPSRSSIASSIDASSAPSLGGGSSAPHVQFRSPDPVLRANRPPGLAWAIKTRGRGWGIVPMQGTREEIKFGPKGKWRTNDNGVRSNRSSLSSRGPVRRSSSKDTEPRSRGGSGMSSESGMSLHVPERDEDGTRMSPDLSAGQRSTPIPIASSAEGAHRLARKDKSSRKKGGWLSAIKQAGSALSTSSSSGSQPRYSVSASSSGTDPTGSQGKEGNAYQPPWLMAAGGSREEKSSLASKLKFKRRSVTDRRDKGTSSGGEGGDLSTSLNSRKIFEIDDEADDGEAREGKAWEDVPIEALAMVIPLAVPKSPASVHSPRFSSPESSPDVAKDGTGWVNRHSVHIDPLAAIDEMSPPRRKGRERIHPTLPPPRPENSLLVYFVPFGCDVDRNGVCHDPSHAHGSTSATPTGPSRIFYHMRLKKTGSQVFPRGTSTPPPQLSTSGGSTSGGIGGGGGGGGGSTTRPPSGYLGSNLSYNSTTSTNSGGGGPSNAGGSSLTPVPPDVAFSSFRIVARVVDPSDLTFIPSWPSWESQGPAPHASSQPQVMLSEPGTNPETKAKESRTGRTDPTVVGVYHGGGEAGVEFVREGWERLGFVRPMPDEGDANAITAGSGGSFVKEAPLWGSVDEDGETALGSVLGAVTAACVAILSPPEL